MEQVWEWRSANPEDWQQLTDSFYKAVSSSAVCAVGIINERYKEFRVQLFSDEKNYFAYLQQGPANLRVGVKAEDPSLSDLSELTDIVHVIGNGLIKINILPALTIGVGLGVIMYANGIGKVTDYILWILLSMCLSSGTGTGGGRN